jgi:hypothetical protein
MSSAARIADDNVSFLIIVEVTATFLPVIMAILK